MRPRVLHNLSRHLAIALEEGIRGGAGENPIPVYLCHPLDLAAVPLSSSEGPVSGSDVGQGRSSGRAAGALYLCRVGPDTRYRQAGTFAEPSLGPALAAHVRRFGLWVRLRFAFMVLGGSHEEELGALSGALQALSAAPFVEVDRLTEDGGDRGGVSREVEALPLEIVEDASVWRELGMEEHHLAVVFDVLLPLESPRAESVGKVVDRDISIETTGERVVSEGSVDSRPEDLADSRPEGSTAAPPRSEGESR